MVTKVDRWQERIDWGFVTGICTLCVVYGMAGQWGPAYSTGKLYTIFCDNLFGERI